MTRGERSIETSLDLGLTTLTIVLTEQEALLPTDPIHKNALQEIAEAEVNCFLIFEGVAKKNSGVLRRV